MSKELWFAQYERLQAEFEDENGRMPSEAEDMDLAELAHVRLRERLFDAADRERKRRRENEP